jgi:hypothetical protein
MIYFSISAALLLFLVLALTIARSAHPTSDLDLHDVLSPDSLRPNGRPDEMERGPHSEILQRIFSQDDHLYVAEVGDPRVEQLLLRERKRVAISWIRRKVAEARFIMREHARRARGARNLEVSDEVRLAFQYLKLLALCELLVLTVFFFGPAACQGLALRTHEILLGMRRLGESAALDADIATS